MTCMRFGKRINSLQGELLVVVAFLTIIDYVVASLITSLLRTGVGFESLVFHFEVANGYKNDA